MDAEESSVSTACVFDLGPRSAWCWLTVGVGLLGAAEAIGLAAIFHAVLPRPVAGVFDLMVGIPTVGLLIAVASALTGRMMLDADHLRLRFGLIGSAIVPRGDISGVEVFAPAAVRPIGLGIDVPEGSQQATVSRGGRVPYVRILLDRPVEVRFSLWRRAEANELVVGTTAVDRLIAALA
jgi:hypothetical protein